MLQYYCPKKNQFKKYSYDDDDDKFYQLIRKLQIAAGPSGSTQITEKKSLTTTLPPTMFRKYKKNNIAIYYCLLINKSLHNNSQHLVKRCKNLKLLFYCQSEENTFPFYCNSIISHKKGLNMFDI